MRNLFLLPMLLLSGVATAQPNTWSSETNFASTGIAPHTRSDAASFVIGTTLYVCGGGGNADLWAYAATPGLWAQKEPLPAQPNNPNGGTPTDAAAPVL